MHLLKSILASDYFAGGALGGVFLSLVHGFLAYSSAVKLIFSDIAVILISLIVSIILFGAAGGVLAYMLSLNGVISAFITGLTAIGFFSLFAGELTALKSAGKIIKHSPKETPSDKIEETD